MFIRYCSTKPAQSGECSVVFGGSGDLTLPDDVLEALLGDPEMPMEFDPTDLVAQAVIDACRYNARTRKAEEEAIAAAAQEG